jgi:multidrug resistance protein
VPQLPFYALKFQASAFVVGLLFSSFQVAQLLVSPLWGWLSDHYGRKPTLIAGLFCSAIAYLIFGAANALWLLFACRLIQGIGGGTTGVVQAYVADVFPPEQRAQGLGWLTSATSAGVMIGSAVGSLAAYLGHQAPGFLAAGLCLLNMIFAWIWLPESRQRSETARPRRSIRETMRELPFNSPVWIPIWIYSIGMMAFMGMNGVLPLFLQRFGVTEKTIGWFFVGVGFASVIMRAFLLGPAVRRYGEVGATRLGALSLFCGFVAISLAPNLWVLPWAVLFVPIGTALLFPATTSLVSSHAPRETMGGVMGLQQTFGGISRVIGPIVTGALFELGPRYPFWVSALLAIAVMLMIRRLPDAKRAPRAIPEAVVEPR